MNDINDLLAIIDMAQDCVNNNRIDEAELHLMQAQRLIDTLRKEELLRVTTN